MSSLTKTTSGAYVMVSVQFVGSVISRCLGGSYWSLLKAYLNWVILTEHEFESVCFACVYRVLIKHLDVQQPTLKVVCFYKCYARWELTLHLSRGQDELECGGMLG